MSPERWNDDRLDDFYEEFRRMVGDRREGRHHRGDPARRLRGRQGVPQQRPHLRSDLATAAANQVIERRSDRRWLIGTCLSSAALIIAAVGVLLGHIG
jgi:glutathione S-transferase